MCPAATLASETKPPSPSLSDPVNPTPQENQVPILLGTPTLGLVRMRWHSAMQGMVTPPNFSLVRAHPEGYRVPDAQNCLATQVLNGGFRALILIEDDNVPPPGALLAFDRHLWRMEHGEGPPIVSGLYVIKGSAEIAYGKRGGIKMLGPEPLVYRGGGQRAFRDWTLGDYVWVDGVPTGALIIHRSILEAWAKEVDSYEVPGYPMPVKRIFEQPAKVWVDPDGGAHVASGTSDLYFSSETIRRDIFRKAGWHAYARRRYPYLIDTTPDMHFGHIDRATGHTYYYEP